MCVVARTADISGYIVMLEFFEDYRDGIDLANYFFFVQFVLTEPPAKSD